jgi:hypothetical protein
MVRSDLGELRLLVCPATMRIEQVVDIVAKVRWRKHFTVGMVSAANVLLQTGDGSKWFAEDGRQVNEKHEVIILKDGKQP